MPQHSYKQLEEAYQRGVNKEHNQTQQECTPCHPNKGRHAWRCQKTKPNQHNIRKTPSQTATTSLTSQQ